MAAAGGTPLHATPQNLCLSSPRRSFGANPGTIFPIFRYNLPIFHLRRSSLNLFDDLPALHQLYLQSNLLDQEGVDEALAQVHAARATYTDVAPELRLEGTNAPPSGNRTDPASTPGIGASNADWSWNGSCHDPLSGKAMAYALMNDNCDEGFNRWSVSYSP